MSSEAASSKAPENSPVAYKNKGDLTKGPVKDHLIRLSVPMMWGIGAIISFQLVDLYFIAQLGTDPLAAVTFTLPITFMIFSFIMGFGIAMSSVISRLIGEGRQDASVRVTTHGLLLVVMIGLVLAVVGYVSQESLFSLMGAPPELLPMVFDYMTIWYAGAVFITMPLVGNAAIRASGDTFTPAMGMTFVALVNVILDPILIFGLFGFPRLEVQGAAIATVISYALAVFFILYVLFAKKKLICPRQLANLHLFWDSVKRLLFIALPAGLTNAIQPFVNAVIISLLAQTGVEAVAAYGIVSRIEAFAFIVIMGVAVGMGPIIGQNFGAGNGARVREVLNLAIRFAVIYSLFVAAVLIFFGAPIAGIFDDNPLVVKYAVLFFWIVPITYAFSNLVNGWASAFNAMGMPQWSFVMVVGKMLCGMIPAIYLGYYFYDIAGLFTAIAVVNVCAGVLFHMLCWRTCYRKTAPETLKA